MGINRIITTVISMIGLILIGLLYWTRITRIIVLQEIYKATTNRTMGTTPPVYLVQP